MYYIPMEKSNEILTPEKSLDLIGQMIAQAQGKLERNSFYFLLWGWIIAFCNFGVYALLKFTKYPHPYLVWMLAIPAWIITIFYSSRQSREAMVKTHLDRINLWLWIISGVAMGPIVLFGFKINFYINPLVLNMIAIPTFLTGIILKFRPLVFGGISFFLFCIVAFMVDPVTQYLIGGIAMICGYLVPGYLLRSAREK